MGRRSEPPPARMIATLAPSAIERERKAGTAEKTATALMRSRLTTPVSTVGHSAMHRPGSREAPA